MGTTMCGSNCVSTATDNSNCGTCGTMCMSGRTCQMGSCRCAMGTTMCGSRCVNLQTDNGHCGSCGTMCTAGRTCQMGTCRS
jgi:hypothetical protein